MAIIKIIKRDCPYLTIDKKGIDDSKLSWESTGLLTYLIGRPSNWKINITHLSSVKKNGERSTRKALLELREHNYCHYFEIRKKGRVIESIYLIFEIPTNPEENITSYISLQKGERLYYKEVKRDTPKVRNEVSVEDVENCEVEPKVRNAKGENAKGENAGLIIIENNNNNNNRKNKKNSHAHDEMNYFEHIFADLKIPYTIRNQNSVKELLKRMDPHQVEKYLRELHQSLLISPNIKNLEGLFTIKLDKKEYQSTYSPPTKIQKGKTTTVSQKKENIYHEKQKIHKKKECSKKETKARTSNFLNFFFSLPLEKRLSLEEKAILIYCERDKINSKTLLNFKQNNQKRFYKLLAFDLKELLDLNEGDVVL